MDSVIVDMGPAQGTEWSRVIGGRPPPVTGRRR
jgi:hypothetical protein